MRYEVWVKKTVPKIQDIGSWRAFPSLTRGELHVFVKPSSERKKSGWMASGLCGQKLQKTGWCTDVRDEISGRFFLVLAHIDIPSIYLPTYCTVPTIGFVYIYTVIHVYLCLRTCLYERSLFIASSENSMVQLVLKKYQYLRNVIDSPLLLDKENWLYTTITKTTPIGRLNGTW